MDIFSEILSALETEERVMVATIISTSGSTPASAFSKMLVKNNCVVSVGTVGGGCMEGDVLLHARRLFETNKAEILTFHLNEDDIEHGLICGGSLDVLIEPVTKEQCSLFQEGQLLRSEGEDYILETFISAEGNILSKKILRKSGMGILDFSEWKKSVHIPLLQSEIEKVFHRSETRKVMIEYGVVILEPVSGTPDLIIFGGGHVSKYLSKTAAMAGFNVTVIDDREKFANPIRFPEAAITIIGDYEKIFARLLIKSSTYIVIVTRGHQFDELVLQQAVTTPAKYIGMIGSKRKVLATYEHLMAHGISVEQLLYVHSPMGIEIGAITAEEIAISIVAEMIRVRRGEKNPLAHKSEHISLERMAHSSRKVDTIG